MPRSLARKFPMTRLRRLAPAPAYLLAVFTSLVLAACGGGDAAPARDDGGSATAVTTVVVQPQPWSDTIEALGTVTARESVDVTAKVSETVQRVHFDSGDEVAAGAVLVTLSGQQQQAALAAAEAEAEEADRLLRRQEELAGQQLIARASLDTQRAIRDSARARVQEIRANLGDRTIRAPFAGVLGIRQVSPGALVTPGTVIASLDDVARVYVDFPVPESQLAQLASGQVLTGTSSAYPGRTFEGEVSIVDARIDPATRAVTVRGDFPNPDRALRPGMLMRVTLVRPSRQALLVPEISVVQVGNDSYVFRVTEDGTVERADVQIGARRGGQAEVVRGLEAGDRVVVDGTGKLRPGQAVREGGVDPAAPAEAGAASGNASAPGGRDD
jgi:membrane fusion protein, multidrug efflux system